MNKAVIRTALGALIAVACATLAPAKAQEAGCANPDAIGTARTLVVPAGDHVGAATGYPPLRLAAGEVVLTFDDGPRPETTLPILDTLARNCVKATFFSIGANAADNPDILKRIIAAGHSVGGHTWGHTDLRPLPLTRAIDEISRGLEPLKRAGARVAFFRFPQLGDSEALLRWLDRAGIATIGVDIDPADWANDPPERTLARIRAQLSDRGERGIILLHDNQPNTALMLPNLLSFLKQRGYRIVHIAPGEGG